MKKSLIIAFVSILSLGMFSSLIASPPIQLECINDFLACTNDAELEYTSTIGAIQDSEKKAQKMYVAAVRNCVLSYNHCHSE